MVGFITLTEAKDIMTSALFGLVILLASYLVLNTINPELTIIKIPGLEEEDGFPPVPEGQFKIPTTPGQPPEGIVGNGVYFCHEYDCDGEIDVNILEITAIQPGVCRNFSESDF